MGKKQLLGLRTNTNTRNATEFTNIVQKYLKSSFVNPFYGYIQNTYVHNWYIKTKDIERGNLRGACRAAFPRDKRGKFRLELSCGKKSHQKGFSLLHNLRSV